MRLRWFPSKRAMLLLAVPAGLSWLLVIDSSWWLSLLTLDAAILLILLVDAWLGLPSSKAFRFEQEMPGTWSHNRPEQITLHLDHLSRFGRNVTIIPDLPRNFQLEDGPIDTHLPGRQRATLTCTVRARERGSYELQGIHLGMRSRLGLWHRHFHLGEVRTVHVYPNLKQLGEYALLARTDRLSLIGVRRLRRIGGDTEFERLRDYQSDDPLQRIDWKATARRDQLTVRDYQISQSQSIVFMLDAGRMMVSRHNDAEGRDAGNLLDRAIDALLMLAFVAIGQGDRVGLIAYADGVKRYVPPAGGQRQLNTLIHAVHDLQADLAESRHEEAFLYLEKHERKRSLAILLTHVIDQVNADMLQTHLRHLSGRHLPIAVLLRDQDIHGPLDEAPKDEAGFWLASAAALVANWRNEVLQKLRQAGAMTVDVSTDGLTPALISRYLEVKAKHLL